MPLAPTCGRRGLLYNRRGITEWFADSNRRVEILPFWGRYCRRSPRVSLLPLTVLLVKMVVHTTSLNVFGGGRVFLAGLVDGLVSQRIGHSSLGGWVTLFQPSMTQPPMRLSFRIEPFYAFDQKNKPIVLVTQLYNVSVSQALFARGSTNTT